MASSKPLYPALFPAALAILIAACSAGLDTPVPNYLARLGRSLDSDIPTPALATPGLPRARDMRVDLEPGSIGILDLLALGDCEVQVTIGKSNSSLGKLATSSQRLLLELEFLELAPPCIETLESRGQQELADLLLESWEHKRRQLPARVWNATLGGPEFRAFWNQPMRLDSYPDATGGAVPGALEQLDRLVSQWSDGMYAARDSQLEQLLDMIRGGDGGALLKALEIQAQGLGAANAAITERRSRRPLCFGNRPSPNATIFDNVVRKYFIGEVQPWSVKLERRRRSLLTPLRRLEQRLASASTAAYQQWQAQRDTVLASSIEAPRRHAIAIAELLETCGLRPGVPPASDG